MKISILGCGVYGLALANTFLEKDNNKVFVWSKFESEVLEGKKKYLSITFTSDLEIAVKGADLIVIAIPIAFLNDTVNSLKEVYKGQDILIASKGIAVDSGKFAIDIVKSYLKEASIGVISGGTFATDMFNKKVMGITLGTRSDDIKEKVRKSLEADFLRVQYIEDVVGVSVCGAIKNVMAIGFGMLDGAGFPPSSKFLFLTEAIYEIKDLIEALGGDKNTIMSYAGIDDIMMTCTSVESRNYTLGSMIGNGLNKDDIDCYKNNTTIEGLGTAEAIYKLAKDKDIVLPIVNTIYNILFKDVDIEDLINLLENN